MTNQADVGPHNAPLGGPYVKMVLVHQDNHEPAIRCLACGATSYNPHDLRNRYCGRCHQFGELVLP